MSQPIRVLFVVSSPLMAKALERLVEGAPDIEVVGVAKRTTEALGLVTTSRPHLVCIEEAPPTVNGLELAREVMSAHPCPILIIGDALNTKWRSNVLEAGALDVLPRPSLVGTPDATTKHQFATRLKMLARVPVIGRRSSGQAALGRIESVPVSLQTAVSSATPGRIVAIGASTGGPVALMTILSALPANYAHPIVCVQHVSRGFLDGMISWLNVGCRLEVRVAQVGDRIRGGTILFPPEDRHLEIGMGGRVCLSDGPPRDGHRPSATVLFESVAASYGSRATAVLLTGMGADGASGLMAVHDTGGNTIAQNEESCIVFGMPRVAIERGAVRHICSPEEIARRLLNV